MSYLQSVLSFVSRVFSSKSRTNVGLSPMLFESVVGLTSLRAIISLGFRLRTPMSNAAGIGEMSHREGVMRDIG